MTEFVFYLTLTLAVPLLGDQPIRFVSTDHDAALASCELVRAQALAVVGVAQPGAKISAVSLCVASL